MSSVIDPLAPTTWHVANWWKLLLGLILTTVVSLGVHETMTDRLQIPYPTSLPMTALTRLPEAFFLTLGSFISYRLISNTLRDCTAWTKWVILFLLLATLKEALIRAVVMDMVDTGVIIVPVVKHLPQLLYLAGLAGLVAITTKKFARGWTLLIASVLIAAVSTLVFRPVIGASITPLLAALAHLDGPSRFQPPYDYHILIPAYFTFIEPVIASFILAAFIWGRLPKPNLRRTAAFTLLIFFIRGPVISPILNIFFAKSDAFTAVLSVAQFSFESILLGLLTAITWSTVGNVKGDQIGQVA